MFRPLLLALLDLLKPRLIVAIGQDAVKGLADLGVSASPVRHPSYGGKADFVQGLASLYGNRALDRTRQPQLALE
jgi:uracil-DNA glycosylase